MPRRRTTWLPLDTTVRYGAQRFHRSQGFQGWKLATPVEKLMRASAEGARESGSRRKLSKNRKKEGALQTSGSWSGCLVIGRESSHATVTLLPSMAAELQDLPSRESTPKYAPQSNTHGFGPSTREDSAPALVSTQSNTSFQFIFPSCIKLCRVSFTNTSHPRDPDSTAA